MDDAPDIVPGEAATCRICRSEGSAEEPLFHPCRCSGSIRNVHQDCLVEWLLHSQKKHCELCKTPFRFTKLYHPQMPAVLPWNVFIRRALVHIITATFRTIRVLLVFTIWLVLLPWLIRWAWRWMFWFADAGWARDIYLARLRNSASDLVLAANSTAKENATWNAHFIKESLQEAVNKQNITTPQVLYDYATKFLISFGVETFANTTRLNGHWTPSDASIFSSLSYISELTPYPHVNRILLDVFEGQLITCTVILAFILVFLIREWVVQQQPIVNLDQLNVQREQAEQARAQQQRFELLAQAHRTLQELEGASASMNAEADQQVQGGMIDTVEGEGVRPRMPDRGDASSRAIQVQRLIEEADAILGPDTAGLATLNAARALAKTFQAQAIDNDAVGQSAEVFKVLPITNAGPDAKLNIKRRIIGKATAVPAPRSSNGIVSQPLISNEVLQERLNAITAAEQLDREDDDGQASPNDDDDDAQSDRQDNEEHSCDVEVEADEAEASSMQKKPSEQGQAKPDGTSSEAEGSFELDVQPDEGRAVEDTPNQGQVILEGASQYPGHVTLESATQHFDHVTLEDASREETHDMEHTPAEAIHTDSAFVPSPNDLDVSQDDDYERRPEERAQQTMTDKLADWFWADIKPDMTPERMPMLEEQHINDHGNVAPLVPVNRNHPQAQPPAWLGNHQVDPAVWAAAEQAVRDADIEAVEEADDIDGILELIGLRGPLTGLLQTSLFCLLLVVCTVLGAVVTPYIWGKLVLLFIGNPLFFILTIPLRIVSFLADFLVDITLFSGAWFLTILTISTEALWVAMHTLWPKLAAPGTWIARMSKFSLAEAGASGDRLHAMFVASDGIDPLGINAGFLVGSVHAHVSLKELQAEVNGVVGFFSTVIRKSIEVVAFGRFEELHSGISFIVGYLPTAPKLLTDTAWPYVEAAISFYNGLRNGSVILPSGKGSTIFDPALLIWSSTDRTLAVCAGYAALAFLAAVYVAADTPITRSGQKTEKMIRDSLRQAGGVFKVILIISIEMLVFPLYCGMLLDLAFLPLFADASLTSRMTFAASAPYVFCFVHWFVGTCYMFHFALFVGMCRKILRRGVLWFIRDPDDPTFHPVRDVLERNVTTQLRKIAFSALVYGALVILCLGGVIWGIGKICDGIFPIYWTETEPTFEFPVDLLLYNFITPIVIGLFQPGDIIHGMYAWWLRRCARLLRLSHFLFDDRKNDEEGHTSDQTWSGISRFIRPDMDGIPEQHASSIVEGFQKDGQYVLTPCNDQYRPPKRGEAFLHVEDEDVFVADKNGKRNESFATVYIPPFFKTRVTLFMTCLWIFSAFSGLSATLLPLVIGRSMLTAVVPDIRLNDIYAYSMGAYALGGTLMLARQGSYMFQAFSRHVNSADLRTLLKKLQAVASRVTKVVYVYGFVFLVLPLVLGVIVEMHFMVPLHTYFKLSLAGKVDVGLLVKHTIGGLTNSTMAVSGNSTTLLAANKHAPMLMHHTVHIAQDLALGVLILRIIARSVTEGRSSRAAEAVRRAIRNGRLDPDANLTTRYLVLPTMVLSVVMLLLPPLIAGAVILGSYPTGYNLSTLQTTLLYRFSYPATSACLLMTLFFRALVKATSRWRARIRDEVYLEGERLHNFGEKRPPVGSRSILRLDGRVPRA